MTSAGTSADVLCTLAESVLITVAVVQFSGSSWESVLRTLAAEDCPEDDGWITSEIVGEGSTALSRVPCSDMFEGTLLSLSAALSVTQEDKNSSSEKICLLKGQIPVNRNPDCRGERGKMTTVLKKVFL